MEFELTRHNHLGDATGRLPYTISACFKQPPMELVPEAWRILLKACKGKELFSTHAMLQEPNRDPRKIDWSLAVGSLLVGNVRLGLVNEVCRSMLVE